MERFLVIGPNTNSKDATITGGAIVLFEHLLSELNKNNIDYILVDTNKKNYSNIIMAYLSIYFQIFIKQFQVSYVTLHSSRDYLYLVPFILMLNKVTKKKIILRKFGGEAWKRYSESKGLKRFILRYIFSKVDGLFLEMKYLVKNFKEINANTYWFPNVRSKPNIKIKDKEFSKRFVFMSHVKKEKGIDEIVEVSKLLDKSYTIDIYGSIADEKYSEEYFKEQGINYKGALAQNEVLETLASYDVLLLPTYYKGEGYPGIVIEAYSLGIPIIATTLEGLREITDVYETGILIEPKDIDGLQKAIEYFDVNNYSSFSFKAKEYFSLFDGERQTEVFLNTIRIL